MCIIIVFGSREPVRLTGRISYFLRPNWRKFVLATGPVIILHLSNIIIITAINLLWIGATYTVDAGTRAVGTDRY